MYFEIHHFALDGEGGIQHIKPLKIQRQIHTTMIGKNTYEINIPEDKVHQFNPEETPITQESGVQQASPDGNLLIQPEQMK